MKKNILRSLALLLCAVIVFGSSAVPAYAVAPEESEEVIVETKERRSEYISYYSLTPPTGSSSGYTEDVSTRSGSVDLERAAVDMTWTLMTEAVWQSLSAMGFDTDLPSSIVDAIVGDVQPAIAKYAPDSTSMDFECETKRNPSLSTGTSEYLKHTVRYIFEDGTDETRVFYETKSWI